ncbi:MAG TPA: hypothetical protein VMM55_02825, partial [Thermohalobaculum sp.]|nr:hypothetical protein [Thermohalobaculum sp.]
ARQAAACELEGNGGADPQATAAALTRCHGAAEAGGHRLVALRAARDLLRLALKTGEDHDEAAARLRDSLAPFRKSPEAGDVVEARALLAKVPKPAGGKASA